MVPGGQGAVQGTRCCCRVPSPQGPQGSSQIPRAAVVVPLLPDPQRSPATLLLASACLLQSSHPATSLACQGSITLLKMKKQE